MVGLSNYTKLSELTKPCHNLGILFAPRIRGNLSQGDFTRRCYRKLKGIFIK